MVTRSKVIYKGFRATAKQDDVAEEGKKKRGGIQIPEEWPWEEAKKLFQNPDVTPADQISVSVNARRSTVSSDIHSSSSGKNQMSRGWLIFLSGRKDSCVSL